MGTDLSKFTIGDYKPGAGKIKILIWYFINYYLFNSAIPWPNKLKLFILRLFGAKVGVGVIIKPRVRIKNPWRFKIGDNCWIGESAWIDNLEDVVIGNNVCISQGAMLLTGNHDYRLQDFPYRLGKIVLEDGVWIGAKTVVCPGVTCKSHAILTVNSVATKQLDEMCIYSGTPAIYVRQREFISQ
jgi:putative colanic acid biosynthesis acetyltransferase WcaF